MDFIESFIDIVSSANFFFVGIVFIITITIYLTGSKRLNSRLHSLFWLIVFLYLLFYSLSSIGIVDNEYNYGDNILFFIPIFGWFYILTLKYKKFNPFLLFLFIIPLISIFFKSKIVFFFFYYDFLSWVPMLITSVVIFAKKNERDEKEKKINLYIFQWTISIFSVFFMYLAINAALSFMNGYPAQILMILPLFFSIASIIVFFIFYRSNLYFNDDILEKSSIYERQTVTEKLASSLVHEIKNPIAAIKSLTQQLQVKFKELPEETIKKYLEIISSDLERVKNLSDAFLKTCKNEVISEDNLSDIYIQLNSVYDLVRFDLQKKEVKLVIDKSTVNQRINLSPYHIRQIFLNLIYNAIEANAKNILIRGEVINKYLLIFIEDDGDGVSSFDIKNIFIPFKSSKPDGTGLGLSICKNILNKREGDISLYSSKKGKTIFKLTIELKNTEN
ncbi:MAG TPA: HAMP domain-containing sensor histidine kinase [Spirochaetota bacterium]|nr:HAMP domain-containing sensor histidine kinase [Spirochaetota bacterium]